MTSIPPFAATSSPSQVPAGSAPANYLGAFLNLDRSPERRQEIETQLQALEMTARYVRFPAVDGETLATYRGPLRPGEVGCFLSHFRALEQMRAAGKCVHIMEDDVLLSRPLAPMIEFIIAQGVFQYFDIIFTDVYVGFDNISSIQIHKRLYDAFLINSQTNFSHAFKLLSLDGTVFYNSSSYVVGAGAIDRVLALYRQEIGAGPATPFDIFLCRLARERKLRIGYLFPFLSSLRLDRALNTTISGRATDHSAMAILGSNLIRYSFFIERDLAGYASAILDQAVASCVGRARDPHQDFITRAMEYVVMMDDPGQSPGR
jgi:GR25 family glycosyltransferase involved in LPS biosynthesis